MDPSISRRQFVGAAGFLTAAAYSRILGANERLHIGVIGAGGMATGHMHALNGMKESDNVEIISVCDIYDKRRDEAAALTGGKPLKQYHADRKSTRLNSSHSSISYAVFCLKKKKKNKNILLTTKKKKKKKK